MCQGKNLERLYVPVILKILIIIYLTYDVQVYIFQTNVLVVTDLLIYVPPVTIFNNEYKIEKGELAHWHRRKASLVSGFR
jgi:hypothetical protein